MVTSARHLRSGNPQPGNAFDSSAQFRQLQDQAESAAPGPAWRGGAATAYAAKNDKHTQTLATLAVLDDRLADAVDRSASAVARGRRDLDAVKQYVTAAAATVPNTPEGEQRLWPVVGKGSADIADILTRSNGELASIAEKIKAIGTEYADAAGSTGPEAGVEAEPVSLMGSDKEGPATGTVPQTTLDLDDIIYLPPDENGNPSLGPSGYMELVPGSGTWVPDPKSPSYRPIPPKAPLDYNDIVYIDPTPDETGSVPLGPSGYMELVPGSGAWVPDPSSPGYQPSVPQAPVDLTEIEVVDPDALIPSTMVELWPHSGVIMPDPTLGQPS